MHTCTFCGNQFVELGSTGWPNDQNALFHRVDLLPLSEHHGIYLLLIAYLFVERYFLIVLLAS